MRLASIFSTYFICRWGAETGTKSSFHLTWARSPILGTQKKIRNIGHFQKYRKLGYLTHFRYKYRFESQRLNKGDKISKIMRPTSSKSVDKYKKKLKRVFQNHQKYRTQGNILPIDVTRMRLASIFSTYFICRWGAETGTKSSFHLTWARSPILGTQKKIRNIGHFQQYRKLKWGKLL